MYVNHSRGLGYKGSLTYSDLTWGYQHTSGLTNSELMLKWYYNSD